MIRFTSLYKYSVSLLILMLLPITNRNLEREGGCTVESVIGSEIKSVIMLDTRLFSNQSRDIGFNYDMLDYFAKDCNLTGHIDTRPVSDECWDGLLDGTYTILAFDSGEFVPEKYIDKVVCSVPLRNNLVWAVPKQNEKILGLVNIFIERMKSNGTYRDLVYRHYRSYRIESYLEKDVKIGALSPYDEVVKKYGKITGVDWRLLSAIIYQESRYNMATTSNRSAKGLMQIKESTAASYGVHNVRDPELNVKAGTLHFAHLVDFFVAEDIEPEEAVKFALAAYNAGEARIEECRQRADSLGLDRNVWSDVVEAFKTMESFSGKEQTRKYVENVLSRFDEYQRIID